MDLINWDNPPKEFAEKPHTVTVAIPNSIDAKREKQYTTAEVWVCVDCETFLKDALPDSRIEEILA